MQLDALAQRMSQWTDRVKVRHGHADAFRCGGFTGRWHNDTHVTRCRAPRGQPPMRRAPAMNDLMALSN